MPHSRDAVLAFLGGCQLASGEVGWSEHHVEGLDVVGSIVSRSEVRFA